MIIKEHYALYSNKLNNLDEIEKFLGRHKLPKQTKKKHTLGTDI